MYKRQDECTIIGGGETITSSSFMRIECPFFEQDTRIVGTPTFHVDATVSAFSTSGHLFVEMVQASTDMHLGHAVMDLRFHAGGKEGEVLGPGETVNAKMEFFGMDVLIPAGDGIHLIITQRGEDYVPSPESLPPDTLGVVDPSSLSLTTLQRVSDDF